MNPWLVALGILCSTFIFALWIAAKYGMGKGDRGE